MKPALKILDAAWSNARGYCFPNAEVYPHMWLWDSCFHSISWATFHDERSMRELSQALSAQFPNGFLPHMVYAGSTIFRGPRTDVSSFTQPPIYALAAAWARRHGISVPGHLLDKISRALSYFTENRLFDGLAFVVHPWETGCDHSPRWDSWYGGTWDSWKWDMRDQQLVRAAQFRPVEHDAVWSSEFVCAPSFFNAILSHAFLIASELTGDMRQRRMSFELGDAIDELLWDDRQSMYVDRPIVGGGDSHSLPTLDGVLSALGSIKRERALACLDRLRDPSQFAAPFGLRYLPLTHPLYLPNDYWRGPAWPQLEFLAIQACRRWGLDKLATQISEKSRRGIARSGWAEFRNPETGHGLGARPQTWSSLAGAM
jgi:glycogen debranching enzyme